MSKAKKIISMLLVVAMILTVAPVNILASAEVAGIAYQEASFTGNTTSFTVDTSATTEVIRVADQSNPLVRGNYVVAATENGIPKTDGDFSHVSYAGDTPEWPKIVFTINGIKPDETPTAPAISGAALTIGNAQHTQNGTSHTYTWTVGEGSTATTGSDVVYTITYKVSGSTYTAYAFAHVEDVLIMNGWANFVHRKGATFREDALVWNPKITTENRRLSIVAQYQSKNMYSHMLNSDDGISATNNAKGFVNYNWKDNNPTWTELVGGGTATYDSDEGSLGNTDEAYLRKVYAEDVAAGRTQAFIKKYKNGTDGSFTFYKYSTVGTGYDGNRAQPKIYVDLRNESDIRTGLNLKATFQSLDSDTCSGAKPSVNHFYNYNINNIGGEEWNYPYPANATIANLSIGVSHHSTTDVVAARGGHYITYYNGKVSGDSKVAVLAGASNAADTLVSAGITNLNFITYNTQDLYGLYHGMINGSGSYKVKDTQTTNDDGTIADWTGVEIFFDKGVNPQAHMYSSGWDNFVKALKEAGSILVEPDTNQTDIDIAAYNLVVAYQGLSLYHYNVDAYVNHVYKEADGTETLLGQQAYADKTAGQTMLAYHATIPGYEVVESTPQSKLLSGKNESETVTFYYQPIKRQIVLITNNDNADVTTIADVPYGSTVSFSTLEHGTKADFDFVKWVDQNGKDITGDFTMPMENCTLTAQWIPSEIKISAIPVIDGVERTDLVENYTSVRPNADGTTAVKMERPADLEREGYIFVEYYADKELTTLMTWPKSFYLHDSLNYTFYARMVDVAGKIIYETNGGSPVNDSTFTPGQTVTPPETTKKGYTFAGWYLDKELTDPVEAADWTRNDNTGFIAYAAWTPNEYTISFNVGKTSTKYDTKEVRTIAGAADTVIPKDQYPEAPLKFGYIFDGWMLQGKRYDFVEGVTTYPTENITLEAIWRTTEYSAFADIKAYEKLSGEYVEADKASVGDTVTFRMTTQTNFCTGSSVFVFMYDSNFFELVEEGTAAFAVNENNEYISGIDAKIQGVTNDAALPWPEDFQRNVTLADGSTDSYKAMMIAIDPTVSVGNINCEPMSDGEWLVEFQLKVKEGADGSGRVFMDNAWTRNQENIMGTMFYGWAENKNVSVVDTQNNVVTPFLQDATATVTLDEVIPEDITITVNANGGTWADGTEKTFEGRAETEIVGYVAPTREGYTLTVDANGKTVWYKVNDDGSFDTADTWAEGYYGKETQAGLTYAAQWTANKYDINFYVDGELKRVKTVDYNSSLADITYTPAAKQGYKFGGWEDAEGNKVDLSTAKCPLGGMNVYAVWAPATDTPFKIVAHYIANASTGAQGSATGNFTGTTGYNVAIVEAVPETQAPNTIYITLDMLPKVANGNFIYDPAKNTLPIEGVIAADGSLVLDVNYTGRAVAFTFDANGGAWADGSTKYVENGVFMGISNGPETNPTKAGYDFGGWNNYNAGSTPFNADRTFTAKWTPKTYTATFNAVNSTLDGAFADGSAVKTKDFTFGATITAPETPSIDGYNFLGWATTDSATQAESLGKMDDENGKIFYAVYAPIEYFVNYEITWGANSESLSDGPFYIGNTVTLRTPEDKTGYTFNGWTIDGNAADATITIGASDVNVVGTYTAVNVPVYFNANGGFFDGDAAVTEKTVDVAYETAISKPSFTPARAGYEFLGWAETTDAGSALTSLGTVDSVTEEIRFYAVWKATYAAYTIKVYMQDTNGAYNLATPDQVIDTNTGLVGTEVSYTPAEKTGFNLDADSVLTGTVVGDGSLILTVKYIRNKYEVKWLDYNGDIIRTDNVYYGAALSAPEATREGYDFAGWTPSVASTMPANNLEYTATYTVNYYDATFNANGGQFSGGNTSTSVSTAFGSAIVPPTVATITKTGYNLVGWAYEGTTAVVISADGTTSVNMTEGGLKFDAVWEIAKFSLSYRNYNGTEFETFEVDYGTAAADMPAPATNPTRTGYYFNGWVGVPETMPANAVRITPDFQLETYTLKFNTDGGNEIADATVTYNQKYTAPANPTKTGYTFAGWDNTIPTTIGDLGDNGAVITYTAQWTINQYTITFANTGDTVIPAIKQDYNTAVTAPANPTKTGYTFAGWDKVIPTVMPAEDTTITASWTINQYTITFDTDGGTEIPEIKQDYNTAVTAPQNPTREGYTFTGWDKTVPSVMPAENTTVTAQWAIESYTLKFDTAGGNTIADITKEFGAAIDVPADPTREGYTFAGWDKEIYTEMPDLGDNGAEEIFTASWTINKFTITWVIDGETYKTEENVEYGAAITAPVPTKTGYVFSGWAEQIPATMPNNALTFTGSWNPAADTKYTVNIHTMGVDGEYTVETDKLEGTTDTKVYAQYTVENGFELGANSVTEGVVAADGSLVLNVYLDRRTYTVSFNTDGGTEIAPITGLYGVAVTVPADPTKAGYTFDGWDKEIPGTIPAENVTIKASWIINSYAVNFLDANDGVFETFTLEYNAEIAAPAGEPTKVHYTFEGWSLTKITDILNPEDIVNVALIDFENAAPTVPVDGLTIYPVFARVPVALEIPEDSKAKVIESADDGDVVIGYIASLETRLYEDTLREDYIAVTGDGRIEVTLTKFDICGTGTEVRIIDNVTNETVGIYYLVIYGDVNGDADIDATDVSIINDVVLSARSWSSTADRSKILAADINKDGKIKDIDASLLTDVTLFSAEIDQQTGEFIRY